MRLGRAPSDEELAAEAEISLAELADLRSFARTVTSLDRPVGEEGETTFGELLPGEQLEPSEELAIDLRRAALRRAVARLPEDERKLIELRYGLTDEQPGPLRELGRRLGRLTEGVRQIEKRGLERLAMERELETLREAA